MPLFLKPDCVKNHPPNHCLGFYFIIYQSGAERSKYEQVSSTPLRHGWPEPGINHIVTTVAALIGMIPEGLVLPTSVALAVGVIRPGITRPWFRSCIRIEMLARRCLVWIKPAPSPREHEVKSIDPVNNASRTWLTPCAPWWVPDRRDNPHLPGLEGQL